MLASLTLVAGQVYAATTTNAATQIKSAQLTEADTTAITYTEATVDKLHQAATRADWDTYFSLYLPEAVFIGTDATEHWNMSEFEGYAQPMAGSTHLKPGCLCRQKPKTMTEC
ncbi:MULTISPECIES: nuclear transport factor 2 family protein [Shewanella]|uniref:nuclear transport factor 2 family protein n=1 Tax=Shewanella TaxID=22 RepID=UPI001E41D735|nr:MULTISPECIES: nuclear transport factor 2 family protein [Shewanella]